MPFSCVTIGGRLTRDPELKYVGKNDTALTSFGMAFGETRQGEEKPAFIDVKVWGKSAEFVNEHFTKGQECVVIGSLEMEEWTDKQSGAKRSRLTVNATSMKFAGQKREQPARDENRTMPQPAGFTDRRGLRGDADSDFNEPDQDDGIPF